MGASFIKFRQLSGLRLNLKQSQKPVKAKTEEKSIRNKWMKYKTRTKPGTEKLLEKGLF